MPIFQDDLDHSSPVQFDLVPPTRSRRLSEESISTELCEGPVPDSPVYRPTTSKSDDDAAISNRSELIERLKRGESPTWVPNRHLESILQHRSSSVNGPKPPRTPSECSTLLPPAQITPERNDSQSQVDEQLREGLSIERPRSALHSGDFTTQDEGTIEKRHNQAQRLQEKHREASDDSQWIATSPPRDLTPYLFESRIPYSGSTDGFKSSTSPLSSLSSSFVFKAPTSPLVQSESNEELDLSTPLDISYSARHSIVRRYNSFSAASSPFLSPSPRPSVFSRLHGHRREHAFPYQAHQPRKSLTSTPSFLQAGASLPTPAFLRSRRSSVVSDSSPIQHASMVGSYEESILRGRMSTNPSKPLEFLAQIGVLGMGKCKSSLKCPPHVTLSFPAVYYSYNSTAQSRSQSDDGPSPYVGQVDLENGLPNLSDEQRSKRKAQTRLTERQPVEDEATPAQSTDGEARRAMRAKRRSGSPKSPPGGSYRIPEKGQIQIIIKNQNKTAVKLFLVPYDLAGMEPGTKTFVRQRSYSAGPIIDNIPSSSELGSHDRPILRYLVHLHICCPSKGRYYLYKSIRIVFANRVPDGKEKLRNETTWPEPRFTPYKPIRVMHPPQSASTGPAAMLAAEKAFRRRSSGWPSTQSFNFGETLFPGPASMNVPRNVVTVNPIPFSLSSNQGSASSDTLMEFRSPSPSSPHSSSRASIEETPDGPSLYEKLNKGDLGYGGNVFGATLGSPGPPESLLSKRLRSMGVKPPEEEST